MRFRLSDQHGTPPGNPLRALPSLDSASSPKPSRVSDAAPARALHERRLIFARLEAGYNHASRCLRCAADQG